MSPSPPPPAAVLRRSAPLLWLLLYAAAIAAITWPWLAHPATRVLSHWDPPFHAWKLAFAARSLLAGHLLPPGGDTNVLYPQSGAFFFEALHWPQAVFAAPFLAAGLPPVPVYHLTLVFFWALSGVAFRFWLGTLGLRDPHAGLGGLFFVLVPYRTSYAVEFNMQLCFALPLLLGAIVLFFRRPAPGPLLLAAAAWWLQAASELYQAVFVLVVLPFFLLPFFARDPSLLRSWRRFWQPVLLGGAACAALSLPFLLPYAGTLSDGTLVRSAEEMRKHALEPFSYVIAFARLHLLPVPHARHDEMSVYPTLALLAASAAAWAAHRRPPRAVNRLFAAALLAAFLATVAVHFLRAPRAEVLARAAAWCGAAAVAASLPCLLRPDRSVPRAAIAGLGAAALAGLVLSFGPDWNDAAAGVAVPNPFFALCAPLLAGFRVVSRFAVFPTIALCTVAAAGVRDASAFLARRRVPRIVRAALLAVFLAAFAVECIPPRIRTRPIRDVSGSSALAAFDALPEPKTIAIVPMGDRVLDSEHMLAIARHDRLSLWAWAGAFPRFSRDLCEAFATRDADRAAGLLATVWPEAFVLEDRRPFGRRAGADFSAMLRERFDPVASDPEFRLWRLRPAPAPAREAIRLVRRDFALARPRAAFTLSAPEPCRVWLDVNGVPLASWDAGPAPATHAQAVPPGLLPPRLPVKYRFHAEGDAPFALAAFALEASNAPPAPVPAPADQPPLPWLPVSAALPPGAIPLDAHYPHGIVLCGVSPLAGPEPPARPGEPGGFRLRAYLRFPARTAVPPKLFLAPGWAENGKVLWKRPVPLKDAIDPAALPSAAGRLVAADLVLPVPDELADGETYAVSFDIVRPSGRCFHPRTGGGKVRHLVLPLARALRRGDRAAAAGGEAGENAGNGAKPPEPNPDGASA